MLDDGVTPSAHQLLSANCNGGTRVVKAPSFPDTYGAGEYQPGYGRSYTFEIEGETQLTNENVYLTFTESVSVQGDRRPHHRLSTRRTGTVDSPQQTSETSLYHATQTRLGRRTYAWPSIPAPLFPDAPSSTRTSTPASTAPDDSTAMSIPSRGPTRINRTRRWPLSRILQQVKEGQGQSRRNQAAILPFFPWGTLLGVPVFRLRARFRVPVPVQVPVPDTGPSLGLFGIRIFLTGTLAAYPTSNGKLAACPTFLPSPPPLPLSPLPSPLVFSHVHTKLAR